jgi:hypothetical protein
MEKRPPASAEGDITLPIPESPGPHTPESFTEEVPEKILSPDALVLESMKQNTDAAMAHAIESADKPIEGQREKRAEVRDDKTQPVAIGSVVADMTLPKRQQPAQEPTAAPPPVEPPLPKLNSKDDQSRVSPSPGTSSLYKRAVVTGFMAALVLLVIWMLFAIF